MAEPARPGEGLDERLIRLAHECRQDPLRFCRVAFPWGEASSELARATGPREWQSAALDEIGERLRAVHAPGATPLPVLKSWATGHSIGKSSLLSMLTLWALTTTADTRVLITAGTEAQLRTKLWPELSRWARLSLFSRWFDVQGVSILSTDPARARTWRGDAVTWSENNTESFQGLHNYGRRILIVFDEASGISDRVWEVTEGILADAGGTEIIWVAAGNPTRPSGAFFRCHHAQRERWRGQQISSEDVEGVNRAQIDEWAEIYGRDSDFFRIRVLGQFPSIGELQFIAAAVVDAAAKREALPTAGEAVVLGADVARFGDDLTCIAVRRGRDARSIPWTKMRRTDTMQVAATVAERAERLGAAAIHVDGGGVGGGVVDRLRQMGVQNVRDVQFGGRADYSPMAADRSRYFNKRAEMWGVMREWLDGGAIPDDAELAQALVGPRYGYSMRDGSDCIILERKQDMKGRGLASPDCADALALTFAYPVLPRAAPGSRHRDFTTWPTDKESATPHGAFAAHDYDPFQGR